MAARPRRVANRVESPDEVAATIAAIADHIPPKRIFPSINCGMVPLARPVAVAKMSALARGARLAG